MKIDNEALLFSTRLQTKNHVTSSKISSCDHIIQIYTYQS